MWHRRVFPTLPTPLSVGVDLLRTTPGLRALLGGALVTWVIVRVLHPHGLALVGLRVTLATPIILLFLALTGEVGRLRRDVGRMRALLGSAPPWRETVTRRRHILLTCLYVVLRVPCPPSGKPADDAEIPRSEDHP